MYVLRILERTHVSMRRIRTLNLEASFYQAPLKALQSFIDILFNIVLRVAQSAGFHCWFQTVCFKLAVSRWAGSAHWVFSSLWP